MAGQRMRRINEAIREVLSEALAEGLKDPRIGFVTVTSVETAPDLRSATVYVSVLGDEDARSQTFDGLECSQGYLQSLIAKELKIRRTPQIRFCYDDSIDKGFRIDELLREHGQE
ncbi:MAG: 30S ribosome-binding factor RbfA [Thermoleophilia bacterium]